MWARTSENMVADLDSRRCCWCTTTDLLCLCCSCCCKFSYLLLHTASHKLRHTASQINTKHLMGKLGRTEFLWSCSSILCSSELIVDRNLKSCKYCSRTMKHTWSYPCSTRTDSEPHTGRRKAFGRRTAQMTDTMKHTQCLVLAWQCSICTILYRSDTNNSPNIFYLHTMSHKYCCCWTIPVNN